MITLALASTKAREISYLEGTPQNQRYVRSNSQIISLRVQRRSHLEVSLTQYQTHRP